MGEFRVSEGLDLRVMIEDEHTDGRDKKKNENAPDTAPDMPEEFAASRRAGFPLSVNPDPFIFFAISDFHTPFTAPFVPLRYRARKPWNPL